MKSFQNNRVVEATAIQREKVIERSPQVQPTPDDMENQGGKPKPAAGALCPSGSELEKRASQRAEQLSQERLLLRTLIDNLPDCIYAKDSAGRKILVNPADLKNLRCQTEADAIGKSDFDFFSRDIAEKFWADDQKVLQGQPVIDREEFFFDETGRKHWLLTSKLPLRDQNNTIIGLVGIGRDITEHKQAADELAYERGLFRALMQFLPEAIYFKDLQSRFVRLSRAKIRRNLQLVRERYLEANPAMGPEDWPPYLRSEVQFGVYLAGKTDFNIYPEERARQSFEDERRILETGEPLLNKLESTQTADGKTFWSLTTKMPWRDENGNIIGTFGVSHDITAIKEAEAKLDAIHKQLLDASRQAGKAEVATSVLHNVGNVLNSVNVASACAADILRQSKAANLSKIVALLREHEADLGQFITADPKGKQLPRYLAQLAEHLTGEQTAALEKLDRLQKNIEHIREIVAMQQDYAKASGVLEMMSVADLVEDALRMNAGSMERHHIKVLREYTETPPVPVDKHKMLQVLVNLIRNAKHACDNSEKPDKQIVLRLSKGNGSVKVSVCDNGVGIATENLTQIFNYGFTTRKDGHGFGLHNAALIAKEMGGSLAAFSEGAGRGATFTLELPLERQEANL